jgi:hypothetical protein
MVFFLLGAATLLVLMSALGMFSRAQIATVKQFGVWLVAIGGLLLAALLFMTGRGATAIAALAMLGPLAWSWTPSGRPGAASHPKKEWRSGAMSRAEAYAALELRPGASAKEIQDAYIRLMRAAHPDKGGSDRRAARLNQARDVLLG